MGRNLQGYRYPHPDAYVLQDIQGKKNQMQNLRKRKLSKKMKEKRSKMQHRLERNKKLYDSSDPRLYQPIYSEY